MSAFENIYKTSSKSRNMSPAEVEAFGAELDALRDSVIASLGEREARYIKRVQKFVRYSEIAGRGLLFAGILPPAWLAGTALLGVSKIVDNMELGHNVMHGQYDWMNDPTLQGNTFDWDTACTADNWRHTHNFMHHTYTNVQDMDHDIGYGVLRLFPEQKWEPRYLANPLLASFLAVTFQWTLALQSLELEKLIKGEKTLAQVRTEFKPILAKMKSKFFKDYILFPLLAGPFFLPVILGNMVANIMRNLWAFAIIFCGHFTTDAETFPESTLANETRGQWYVRQIRGSSNLEGSRVFDFMTGNLSYQIEHHLFPTVPAVRYKEMSVKVQEICAKYGQHYNKGPFTRQFMSVVGRILRYSVPTPKPKNVTAVAA
jgi:linoleoyl-CoA desaturase